MTRRGPWPGGIAARVAVAALATAGLGLAIIAAGVAIVGQSIFMDLSAAHGEPLTEAQQMFDASIMRILLAAVATAAVASLLLSILLARRLARPITEIGRAAQRLAAGDYSVRVPREGPEELLMLADSFNQMAESLAQQEQIRRDFIANAAHELRTPLTNLQGYLEGLRDGVITADRQTYDSLWEEADRLVRLARSLDALAETDRAPRDAELVEVDLAATLASTVELARPGFEGRTITVEAAWPDRLLVRANPDHLAQVVGNLVQNALRYTPEGGRVSVTAEARPGSALVTVANTGEPIPAADLPHIFERFYRVEKSRDRTHGGAGIGLAIVKQLVESAGGRVGVDSGADRTRFWFMLPMNR
ncbi:MAG: HAMP domain-containing histidine kinase [Chloroflexi bacterium]|nr:HAMP domain-containing histidine kinase [Chloroflexota bacterium]